MSFQQTTATTYNDLVDKLYTFAVTTDSWTGVYNSTADEGSERQIGVEKGNCHIAVGARNTENPIARRPSGTDAIVNMALSTALLSGVGQRKYYGHTGSLVTTATDADRILVNDLGEPPFANVWFFSGSGKTHVHCVVQTAGDRYTHFSFGVLDKAGMTHADVAFAVRLRRQGLRHAQGGRDRRHRGRSLQGHRGPGHQPADQDHQHRGAAAGAAAVRQ